MVIFGPEDTKGVLSTLGNILKYIFKTSEFLYDRNKPTPESDVNKKSIYNRRQESIFTSKTIVGSYTFAQTYDYTEEGGPIIICYGTCIYKENGICEGNGTTVIVGDVDGVKSILKINLESYGKYEIIKSYIIYDNKLENIKVTIQSDNHELNKLANDNISQMKNEMIANREKILELNNKYFKTEMVREGKKLTTIYVRQLV